MDVQLNVVGETRYPRSGDPRLMNVSNARWELGHCSSFNGLTSPFDGAKYRYPAIYTERCCLETGRYTLACYSTPSVLGWNNAYITIGGEQYCDNFMTY